jgi:hypothetical protein
MISAVEEKAAVVEEGFFLFSESRWGRDGKEIYKTESMVLCSSYDSRSSLSFITL